MKKDVGKENRSDEKRGWREGTYGFSRYGRSNSVKWMSRSKWGDGDLRDKSWSDEIE